MISAYNIKGQERPDEDTIKTATVAEDGHQSITKGSKCQADSSRVVLIAG
jgi:hypothetical protein